MPLVFYCAIFEAIGTAIVLFLSPHYLKIATSNSLVMLSFIVFGFLFLLFVYGGILTKKEKLQIFILGIFELVVAFLVLQIPFVIRFFNITKPFPDITFVGKSILVFLAFGLAQYFMVKKFLLKKQ